MSAPTYRQFLANPTDNSAEFDALVEKYRRAYQKVLRHRPTDLQRSLMITAARNQALFDLASRNPDLKPVDRAHMARCARQSYDAMLASFPPRPKPGDALSRYLAGVTA